jgi:hypothetical protein
MTVGGEGDVERAASAGAQVRAVVGEGGTKLGELGDHLDEACAQEGFAAGEADFLDAEGDQDADHAEVVGDGQLAVLRALVAGAAVDALVVAAVGDGDTQVGDGAAVGVAEARGGVALGNIEHRGSGGYRRRRWEDSSDCGFSEDWMLPHPRL